MANDTLPPAKAPTAAAAPPAPAAAAAPKQKKEPKAKKEPSGTRSNLSKLYPEDATIKVLVEKNPKKTGSKSAERFEHYFTSKTVGEFLAKGGTMGDILYDVPRNFIAVGK